MSAPDWLDRELYPFEPHHFELPEGRLHYVDEGSGDPIVMLHGNPTWSFLYRHLIRGLSGEHRCIAPDYLGFGLSDKPPHWSYRPEDHAKCIAAFVDSLDLSSITLVVQDWGGPIGLSYAINHPDRIKALVIMNTWMWSVAADRHLRWFSKCMGGPVGRFLIRRFHFFARVGMTMAYADRRKLTPAIRRHYLCPQPTAAERKGCWVFPKCVVGSSDWLDGLWQRRDRIAGKPVLLAWGMKDIAFRERELRRWQTLFPHAKTLEFQHVGHYVQEELGPELATIVGEFLGSIM